MKKWIFGSLAAAVVAVVALAPVASTQPSGWLSFLVQDPQGAVQFRALDSYGFPAMIGHGTAVPTTANSGSPPMDGEVFVVHAANTTPDVQVYDTAAAAWYTFASGDIAQTFTGTQTFSGAVVANGDVTIGDNEDDTLMIDSPMFTRVRTENFAQMGCASAMVEDYSAVAAVTNGAENILLMPCSQIGVIAFRLEAEDGPGLADTMEPFSVDGVMSLDTLADDVDNEGVELIIGSFSPDNDATLFGAYFDEDAAVDMYAEISLTIADISDLDDLWFGWIVLEAYDNPPASATFDTSALFVISDLAGDLDIETQLNGGGVLNDDAVTVWGNTEEHILRVEVGADAVAFILDGVAVAQVNAVLNMDNGDRAVVVLGYTLVANSDPEVTIDYVQIGQEQ